VSPFALLRAVRGGIANGLATLSPKGLIFTHIFGWTPGVEFEVQLSPWLPSALYGLCIRARLQAVPQKGFWPAGFSP